MNVQVPHEPELIAVEGFSRKDLYQRREKIFTRGVKGFYQRLRLYTGWPFLMAYFVTPWIQWNGQQAVLFDLPARQFHIFGITAWPQELWLLGWILIIAAFGLFTVTTLFGRVWCGYTCPQTIWTAIYMWVEQITEGQRHQRVRLDNAAWSLEKLRKRAAKHFLWLGWAFATGFSFVAYFTPAHELLVSALSLQLGGWSAFWILFFTSATYINAGWLREQVCIYMCPYARFQSAMFDQDTLLVSYDAARGEPRGSRKRVVSDAKSPKASLALGDCVDCQLCVQVCPTGIDIRDGLQYECISCALCIDACDQVMKKMGYAPRLISYTTPHALQGVKTQWLRGRSVGYAVALCIMLIAFTVAIFTRDPFALELIRGRGELFHVMADGSVRNDYQLKIMNKQQYPVEFVLTVELSQAQINSGSARVQMLGNSHFSVPAGGLEELPLLVEVSEADSANIPLIVRLCETNRSRCVSNTTRFIGPGALAGSTGVSL